MSGTTRNASEGSCVEVAANRPCVEVVSDRSCVEVAASPVSCAVLGHTPSPHLVTYVTGEFPAQPAGDRLRVEVVSDPALKSQRPPSAVPVLGHTPSPRLVTYVSGEFPAQPAGDRLLARLTGPTG
jgi:hypothetical protein